MRFLIGLFLLMSITSCSTTRKYQHMDYAYGCVSSKDNPDISKNVTDVCIPIDTYANPVHYHKTRPSERRTMPTLDDAMDRQ